VECVFAIKAFKFAVKAAADAAGQFAGRASVYGVVDSYHDVVMPGAFTKFLQGNGSRIKVLNQHDPSDPIGYAELTDSDTALLASGQLVLDLPSAKDMYTRLQNDLIDGISIGYEVVDQDYNNGVRQLKEISLWEISLVTFPANSLARVTGVKTDIARLIAGKNVDPHILRALQHASLILTPEFVDALEEHKAGRVLSDSNRKKVQSAHDTLVEATGLLKDLLDLPDPNVDKGANVALIEQLSANIRGFIAAVRG
jgi:HK97 family phage prohead protease